MEHNTKLCYDAIIDALRYRNKKTGAYIMSENKKYIIGPNSPKNLVISYEKRNIPGKPYYKVFKINDKVYFSMNDCCSVWDIQKDIEKAINEIKSQFNTMANLHMICNVDKDGKRGICVRISRKDYKREKLAENEMAYVVEKYSLCSNKAAYDAVKKYPKYDITLMSGFGWKGAYRRYNQSVADMKKLIEWACAIDVEIDHGKREIFVNGFSENDMY